MTVRWSFEAREGNARAGTLTTPHGAVPTPAFMPVGTRATVKTLDVEDLERIGAAIVLANTYHLMLKPGARIVSELGELHGFMGWDGPILTDSGGYQVFSLSPKLDDDGVMFKSSYDGSALHLTPEAAVTTQEALGADIAMALDVLVGLPASRTVLETAMEQTLRWAERSIRAKTRADRALFGIVQGGTDLELRARSAAATAALGFDGYGIGGVSVGEPDDDRDRALEAAMAELPDDKVRYVMGLGDTEGILAAVARGADLFDCVLPTRLARHGKVLHPEGDFSIKRAEFAASPDAIDSRCGCVACRRYSRGYVRHLFATKEPLGQRLLTQHNLTYTLDLMAGIRTAVVEGRFADFTRKRLAPRGSHPRPS